LVGEARRQISDPLNKAAVSPDVECPISTIPPNITFQMESPASKSSSLGDNLALPEYAQNLLPEAELPTLYLISFGHSPPLKPAPQLKFDVRSLPNPPKHIRDAHNGISKRLQEWMQTDAKFLARRDAIKEEIEEAMTDITAAQEKRYILKLGLRNGGTTSEDAAGKHVEAEEEDAAPKGDEEGSSSESMNGDTVSSRDQTTMLRVGVYCAMGRHRSVAMVEELARLSWPGWRVQVEHRDISKKRGVGKKSGNASRGGRGGTMPSQFGDDSG
jgi:hypothetical protein